MIIQHCQKYSGTSNLFVRRKRLYVFSNFFPGNMDCMWLPTVDEKLLKYHKNRDDINLPSFGNRTKSMSEKRQTFFYVSWVEMVYGFDSLWLRAENMKFIGNVSINIVCVINIKFKAMNSYQWIDRCSKAEKNHACQMSSHTLTFHWIELNGYR